MDLRIGNLRLVGNVLLAPIAGYTDLPFRLVARECGGVALAVTDLINPEGLVRGSKRSLELVRTCPADTPLGLQLYGNDATSLIRAARLAQDTGVDLIDLNMGCPVGKITRRSGGAAMLCDPRAALKVAERLTRAVDIPVTVKMRIGWNDEGIVAPRLAADLERVGVAAVTVHGRTAAQKFSGQVRLDEIARVVDAVRAMPVIGNGDVRSPGDAEEMIRRTGCAGVMLGRAALCDPWLFRDVQARLDGEPAAPSPTRSERIDLVARHFRYMVEHFSERKACVEFRQRISWYARKLRPCADLQAGMKSLAGAAQFDALIQEFREAERRRSQAAEPALICR